MISFPFQMIACDLTRDVAKADAEADADADGPSSSDPWGSRAQIIQHFSLFSTSPFFNSVDQKKYYKYKYYSTLA